MDKKYKIVAIIQARLGSTRLPLKSLLSLRDRPIINWVTSRVSQSKLLDQYIVAIPDTSLDQILAEHLERLAVPYFVGSENDVLARFIGAAHNTQADLVVRICADNPLIWWEAIDQLIEHYLTYLPDYAYNHVPKNNLWPDGLGAEILSTELLEDLGRKASLPSEREHCLNYIWNNAKDFKIETFDPRQSILCRPNLKLDIDTVSDFERLARLPLSINLGAEDIVKIVENVS